jgi:hypothetical protein
MKLFRPELLAAVILLLCTGVAFLACEDSSDDTVTELPPCPENYFACDDNAVCWMNTSVCDGYVDCADGTDENDCVSLEGDAAIGSEAGSDGDCAEDFFICASGECVNLSWACDGTEDCGDGSDEIDCETSEEGAGEEEDELCSYDPATTNITCASYGETEQVEICLEDGSVTVEECSGACECAFEDPFDANTFTCACGCEEGSQKCSTLCNGEAGGQCVLTCQGDNYAETEDCGSKGLSCLSSGGQAYCE